MIPADVLLLFFVSSIALALAPGPDNIFVLTLSAMKGRAAGILVTLGLCSGLIFHTAAVALGGGGYFQDIGNCIQRTQDCWCGLSGLSGVDVISSRGFRTRRK